MQSPDSHHTRFDLESVLRLFAFAILLIAPLAIAAVTPTEGFLWFVFGAIAWGISVVVKIPLVILLQLVLGKVSSQKVRAGTHGILSAACELGIAAVCFLWFLPPGSVWNAASFGAGAGWIEVVILLISSLLSKKDTASTPSLPWHVRWTFVVERAGAVLGHIGSRGLTWLAIQGPLWYALLPIASFAVVDGLAVYGTLRNWDWLELKTWRRFYGIVTSISIVELLLFILLA